MLSTTVNGYIFSQIFFLSQAYQYSFLDNRPFECASIWCSFMQNMLSMLNIRQWDIVHTADDLREGKQTTNHMESNWKNEIKRETNNKKSGALSRIRISCGDKPSIRLFYLFIHLQLSYSKWSFRYFFCHLPTPVPYPGFELLLPVTRTLYFDL